MHEDLPPRLAASKQAHRWVTFLKRACNDIALAGDTVLAFCDEPISRKCSRSLIGPRLPCLVCQHSAARYVIERCDKFSF